MTLWLDFVDFLWEPAVHRPALLRPGYLGPDPIEHAFLERPGRLNSAHSPGITHVQGRVDPKKRLLVLLHEIIIFRDFELMLLDFTGLDYFEFVEGNCRSPRLRSIYVLWTSMMTSKPSSFVGGS